MLTYSPLKDFNASVQQLQMLMHSSFEQIWHTQPRNKINGDRPNKTLEEMIEHIEWTKPLNKIVIAKRYQNLITKSLQWTKKSLDQNPYNKIPRTKSSEQNLRKWPNKTLEQNRYSEKRVQTSEQRSGD